MEVIALLSFRIHLNPGLYLESYPMAPIAGLEPATLRIQPLHMLSR